MCELVNSKLKEMFSIFYIISYAFWFIGLFSYFFQCYKPEVSYFIVPSLVVWICFNFHKIKIINKVWLKLFGIYTTLLIISFSSNLICLNEDYNYPLRFLGILLIIPLVQNIKKNNFYIEWSIFKFLAILKALTLLYIWCDLYTTKDFTDYRLWAEMLNAGDIYIQNGVPKVQLQGNCLVLVGFIVEFLRKRRMTLSAIILMLGTIAAGNTSFIISVVILLIIKEIPYYLRRLRERSLLAISCTVFLAIGCFYFMTYCLQIFETKMISSLPTRFDQIIVLLDTNPLIGNGIGHRVFASTSSRIYEGTPYFELQTLYIYNQIGFVMLSLFFALTFIPYLNKRRKLERVAYFTYLIASSINPYCFDSTHVITLILITNSINGQGNISNIQGEYYV